MKSELAVVSYLVDESEWWRCSRIKGDTDKQRHKRLKREKTRLCLAAGLYLLRKAFGQPIISGGALDGRIRTKLRYDDVVETVNLHAPADRTITSKTLISRWPTRSAFVTDVLSAGLYHRHWALATARGHDLPDVTDFAGFVRAVAYENLKEALNSDLYRLYVFMAAYADSDERVRTAFAETRGMIVQHWQPIYEKALAHWGLRLRDGISTEHLVRRLTVIDEGGVFTLLSSPDEDLLGKTADDCWLARLSATVALDCVADCSDGA